LDQKVAGGFAAASTPYLSLTGMVQPVAAYVPVPQFNNHYTFVQSAGEHLMPKPNSYFNSCNYKPTLLSGGPTNYEEELVVSNPNLFSSGVVSPSIIGEMGESMKFQAIYYPYIKIKMRRGIPVPTVYWRRFYIWKRTYHTLNDNCLYDCDFGYKYLFRN
jgi:hypothetical protein